MLTAALEKAFDVIFSGAIREVTFENREWWAVVMEGVRNSNRLYITHRQLDGKTCVQRRIPLTSEQAETGCAVSDVPTNKMYLPLCFLSSVPSASSSSAPSLAFASVCVFALCRFFSATLLGSAAVCPAEPPSFL
jgi:hypothetical protein